MFVRGETQGQPKEQADKVVNPDEIDIDDDEEEENGGEQEDEVDIPIEKQAIPAQVFGSLKKDEDE